MAGFGRETQQHQQPDDLPCEIEFPPLVTVPRRGGVGMVIVVPSFAAGEKADEQVVAAAIAGGWR